MDCAIRKVCRSKRVTLGSLKILDADKARFLAKEILAKVVLGSDPASEKAAAKLRDQHLFGAIAEQYLEARKRKVRQSSYQEMSRYLLRTFKPLHRRPIAKIDRTEVGTVLRDKVNSGKVTAAHQARSTARAFFAWAIREGYCDKNPVAATNEIELSPSRERVLSDAELAAVWNACDDGSDHSKIVRLLILTGARRDEIGGLRWSELNLKPQWTLPRERSKNKHPLTLTLPGLAWSIIDSVERRQFSEFLFGTRGKDGANNWFKPKRELDQRIGFSDWRLHDLRRTVATGMAEGRWLSKAEKDKDRTGIQPHIIEAVLNHRGGHKSGIAGVYNRASYDREVRNALAIWAEHVASITSGQEKKILQFPAEAQDRA